MIDYTEKIPNNVDLGQRSRSPTRAGTLAASVFELVE